jgi:hypothetical protein
MSIVKTDNINLWNFMYNYFQQKFFIACINTVDEEQHKSFRNV